MTKKDYQRIADAIKSARADAERDTMGGMNALAVTYMCNRIIVQLSDTLREDNPRFDADRFRKACLA